jgi:hypothetical protein
LKKPAGLEIGKEGPVREETDTVPSETDRPEGHLPEEIGEVPGEVIGTIGIKIAQEVLEDIEVPEETMTGLIVNCSVKVHAKGLG